MLRCSSARIFHYHLYYQTTNPVVDRAKRETLTEIIAVGTLHYAVWPASGWYSYHTQNAHAKMRHKTCDSSAHKQFLFFIHIFFSVWFFVHTFLWSFILDENHKPIIFDTNPILCVCCHNTIIGNLPCAAYLLLYIMSDHKII